MFRDRPGLKFFLGGFAVLGVGFLVAFNLDEIVGIVLVFVAMFLVIAFKFPRDWDAGWPPPWLDDLWNVWIRGRPER